MTYQLSIARLRARAVQSQMQALKRGFLRRCKASNTDGHVCLMRARSRVSARMREGYILGLLVLLVLLSLKENGGFPPFHVSDLRKGAQGHRQNAQGCVL